MADRLKFARFDCEGELSLGVVQGEEVAVIDGSSFGTYRETGIRHRLADVKLLPPVIPTKIVCIGLNYRGHIEEIGAGTPERPQFFLKPPSSLIGHGDAIVIPQVAERVDYEGELASAPL